MKLVIGHYHLNRGGVTSVIINHIHALDATVSTKEKNDILILYGGDKIGWDDSIGLRLKHTSVTLKVVPQLKYDSGKTVSRPHVLAKAITKAISTHYGPGNTPVIHFHNHTLGKNVSLPEAVKILTADGHNILAQIHDFPEDGRPNNYRMLLKYVGANDRDKLLKTLYSPEGDIVYVTINKRDCQNLYQAGVSKSHLSVLQHPVLPITPKIDSNQARKVLSQSFMRQGLPPLSANDRFILYPVRGIRRKNIGEALLWSLLAPTNIRLGMTLSPLNLTEKKQYDAWVQFRDKHKLNFGFGLSENIKLGYADILNASNGVLTTSVTEGFGMAYLEPWLINLPVFGRLLPEITSDFTFYGMKFDGTYTHLWVPVDWIEPSSFASRFVKKCLALYKSYGNRKINQKNISKWIQQKLDEGVVDFGFLDEIAQKKVILKALKHGPDEIFKLNKKTKSVVAAMLTPNTKQIQNNKRVVTKFFGIKEQGDNIRHVYEKVLAKKRAPHGKRTPFNPIDFFLDLSRMKMLRM